MHVSVSEDGGLSKFSPTHVETPDELAKIICNGRYSPIVYKNNKRHQSNFDYADIVALDFDGDLSLKEARLQFKAYTHIIAPTKSHQKEKNGIVADRFRVVLFLSERITDLQVYRNTVIGLLRMFPQADPQCKDGARYFEPSNAVISKKTDGKLVNPINITVLPVEKTNVSNDLKGELAALTYEFLTFGAPEGTWNRRLHKAAVDFHEQGYSKTEAIDLLTLATRKELGNKGYLDDRDIKTIDEQYKRETRYDKRDKPKFNFKPLGDIIKKKPKVEWIVDGLLTKGGFSLMVGQPKSGKSTLTRQLALTVTTGGRFLDRKVEKGKVLYLALEEQEEMLYEQFNKLGLKESEENILIHIGPAGMKNAHDLLLDAAQDHEPVLIVVDTLLLFEYFDSNNYDDTNQALTKIREVARKSGAHICAIHHQNKNTNGGHTSIMGSNAIHGAVDNAMLLTSHGKNRILNTSQRGGSPFVGQLLNYCPKTQIYTLGSSKDAF